MTMHVIVIHDDDPTDTPANIAAADFIDGESIVQQRDGQVPILRGITSHVSDITGTNSIVYETTGHPRITLMPSTWKETNKIFDENVYNTIPVQDGTTATDFNTAINRTDINAWTGYDVQLTENMNWINAGDTQWIGFNGTAQNFTVVLTYQYGQAIPWNGEMWPVVVVRKTAADDVSADIWSDVANELFTDDGLDPDAVYRPLWGYSYVEGALNTVNMAWRMTTTDHKTWIGGIGNGSNFGGLIKTWFKDDSMLINGDTQIHMQALGDAAHKPIVVVAFQEVKKGVEPRGAGARATPAPARGPTPGRSLRLGQPGGFGRMFGRRG